METFKNYFIALLMAIIAMLLITQPAQSAGKSIQAKSIEYQFCIDHAMTPAFELDNRFKECARYRP